MRIAWLYCMVRLCVIAMAIVLSGSSGNWICEYHFGIWITDPYTTTLLINTRQQGH